MDLSKYHALTLRGCDVQGAMHRLYDDEATYALCLRMFLDDQTMKELNQSVSSNAWDDAFTAAHALKGVAGNMGFVLLMQSVSRLVVLIRGGRVREIPESLEQVNSNYRDIIDGIGQFLDAAAEK